MRETGSNWQTPDLSDYRDHLLTNSGLAPASVAAHLSTVRGRYKLLLGSNSMRQYLYSLAPDDASAADRKAFVDETLAQLENAIKANAAPLTVIKHQDALDATHLRLSIEQALELLDSPARDARNTRREALRDAALLAVMLCTGLREMEVCALNVDDLRQKVDRQLGISVREGKGSKARFVPYGGLIWCLEYVDAWLASAGITSGAVFRGLRKAKDGQEKPVRSARLSVRAVQDILKRYPVYEDGKALHAAPHDLRRSYARLLHDAGVPPVAIQQNLGHANLETTLRYVGDLKIDQRKPPTILRPNMKWLEVSHPAHSNPVVAEPKKKQTPQRQANPSSVSALAVADLPTHGKPLTKAACAVLFAFCEAEYQRRHGREWRFKGGEIIRRADGAFRLYYVSSNDLSIDNFVEMKSRGWFEVMLLSILNKAEDQHMKLGH